MSEIEVVFTVLGAALILFATGKLRYDLVALGALLILTIVGIIPAAEAFSGFSHPAVVTVAAVLVLSRVLLSSGAIDVMGSWYSHIGRQLTIQITSLSGLVAVLSAFMNNVGALSLLMPLAIRVANSVKRPYSPYLMPLAFSSLLGGMTTLIGTPPNIIISTFRLNTTGEAFNMFDFTPVGLGVAFAGVIFVALVGWRLIPARQGQSSLGEAIDIAEYVTEVRVPVESSFVGRLVGDLEELAEQNVAIVGMFHQGVAYGAPSSYQTIDAGDILILEADPEDLRNFVAETGFALEGMRDIRSDVEQTVGAEDVLMIEAVVVPNGTADGRTARNLRLHSTFGVNLLGISRRGIRMTNRIGGTVMQAGDVLLLQGKTELVQSALPRLNLLPLAERDLQVGQPKKLLYSVGVFAGALALTAVGILPVQISLAAAVLILLVSRTLSLQAAYQAVNWPIIILLGAMIPVGQALETTGGAAQIAAAVSGYGETLPPWAMLAVVLVITMFLSDLVNNATAVILMAPIGVGVAGSLGASSDPFLMAVAIGASSAFLSPIGHQSNTIVMGPGGYRFGDYWRMGLPLEVIIVAVAVPLLMWFWPLNV